MSVSIKIGSNTETVNGVAFESGTTAGTDINFYPSIGYNITLSVDNAVWQVIQVTAGNSISAPTNPVKNGYVFIGWTTTSGGTTADVTFPYTPASDTTLYAVFNTVLQYKASPTGYGSSSPSSVSFSTNSNLINWTPETVTIGSDIFIKFPTFYRKVVTIASNQITSFVISSWKEDNDFVPYPCFVDEGGNTLPYILVGKYCSTSSSTANSVSGAAANMTIGTARSICRAKGNGYQQMDWMIFKLWQDLICAKMQTIDINSGSGIGVDVLGIAWEQNSSKTYPWIDGVSYQGVDKKWALCYKPSAYVDSATSATTDYSLASYSFSGTSGQEVQSLGYDSSNPFFNYPTTTVSNGSYNTYYCDSVYTGTSTTHPVNSVVGPAAAGSGAFYCYAPASWSHTLGARLCYRPL